MALKVRYVTTADGMDIAYIDAGDGPTFVRMPNAPFEHVQLHYSTWGKAWLDAISAQMRVVAYDCRGSGLSTRDVSEFSLETFTQDLRAVVDGLELDKFVLFAEVGTTPVALAFAAAHPERVTHLIIFTGTARNAELWTRRAQSTHPMLTNATDIYMSAIAGMVMGTGTTAADEFGEYMLACVDGRTARRMLDAQYRLDVTDRLGDIEAPALVTYFTGNTTVDAASIRRLAAGIGATLTPVSGAMTSLADWAVLDLEVMRAFLVDQGVIASGDSPPVPASAGADASGVRTVLFTDLVGHTAMMQRLGDARGRDVLREHERLTRETLRAHGGREVKSMGDGFMASFGSVTRAMDCAIALQRAFAEHSEAGGEPLAVRVGLNAGEPIEEEGDLFGSTVIMASRIAAAAGPGEILIPEPLRHLLSGKSYVYADRGETMLKGFEDTVRLFEVRWRE